MDHGRVYIYKGTTMPMCMSKLKALKSVVSLFWSACSSIRIICYAWMRLKGGRSKVHRRTTETITVKSQTTSALFFAKIIFWGRNTKPICRLIICSPYNIWKRSNHFYEVLIKDITWALFWRLSKKKYHRLHTVLLIVIPKHSCVLFFFTRSIK